MYCSWLWLVICRSRLFNIRAVFMHNPENSYDCEGDVPIERCPENLKIKRDLPVS